MLILARKRGTVFSCSGQNRRKGLGVEDAKRRNDTNHPLGRKKLIAPENKEREKGPLGS